MITTKNPEALWWKYQSEGIRTKENKDGDMEVIAFPGELTQEMVDQAEAEYQASIDAVAYREKRKQAYIQQMGKVSTTDPVDVIGDVLDDILGFVEANKATLTLTDEVQALLDKRASIKQANPKNGT